MPDADRGEVWSPRWDLPPDLPAPAAAQHPASSAPAASATAGRLPPGPPPDLLGDGAPVDAPSTAGGVAGLERGVVLVVVGAVVAVLVAVVALVAVRPWAAESGTAPASSAGGVPAGATTVGPSLMPIGGSSAAHASADRVSAPSKDSAGNPTSHLPAYALDERPDTAWRCDGDGVGHHLTVDFGGPLSVTGVGIVPGLAKTDPYDSTDRYRQGRRISAVRYTFDNGSSVTQDLDTSPDDRSVQSMPLSPVVARTLTVTVLSSVGGEAVGPLPPTEKVAISTLTWSTASP